MSIQPINFPKGQVIDPKTGMFTQQAQRFFVDIYRKLGEASNNAPINSDNITGLLNLSANVTNALASTNMVANAQLNTTNFCTVDSIDNGTSATVRVYGSGGVGTGWNRKVGTTIFPTSPALYPALSQAGNGYVTTYYVMFNPDTSVFTVTTLFANTLPDNLIFCGKVITVASGGGGGTSGGGGGTGDHGGVCFSGNTRVAVPIGLIRFDQSPPYQNVLTKRGPRRARLVVSDYRGLLHHMGEQEWVTPKHPFDRKGVWIPADQLFSETDPFDGKVYNFEVLTDNEEERNFKLANGNLVHNMSMF